jgi:hypothetical protein
MDASGPANLASGKVKGQGALALGANSSGDAAYAMFQSPQGRDSAVPRSSALLNALIGCVSESKTRRRPESISGIRP